MPTLAIIAIVYLLSMGSLAIIGVILAFTTDRS